MNDTIQYAEKCIIKARTTNLGLLDVCSVTEGEILRIIFSCTGNWRG